MDIKEAFYKQKEELHSCQKEVRRLQRLVDRYAKGIAEKEIFQTPQSYPEP